MLQILKSFFFNKCMENIKNIDTYKKKIMLSFDIGFL
jgi:hypothetical protein